MHDQKRLGENYYSLFGRTMSRIGKQEITVPAGTDVQINGSTVMVKGPLGQLERTFNEAVTISLDNGVVTFAPKVETAQARALWGTIASHVKNMVDGVNTKFEKKLIVEGVGYRAEVKGSNLEMQLGFSHPIVMEIPEGVEVVSEKNNISVSGINKELVGLFASKVRLQKKPEPYKGKGIRYADEVIRRKEGKKNV